MRLPVDGVVTSVALTDPRRCVVSILVDGTHTVEHTCALSEARGHGGNLGGRVTVLADIDVTGIRAVSVGRAE